jgi:nucleotide-binding universal stress UspA family protein
MLKKILFATDASPACEVTAKVAFELAEKHESELILFHVFAESSRDRGVFAVRTAAGAPQEGGTDYGDWVKKKLKNLYDLLIQKHGAPEYEAVSGVPSTEILRYARENKVDCIVMGAHAGQNDPAAKRFRGLVGSTVQKVALRARCPVLIVSRPCETCFWYFNQIIFGADFSKASMSAFQFAYRMADHIGCKLHLFHALHIETSQAGVTPGQSFIEAHIKKAREKIEGFYLSRMADFDNYEITVWEGVPHVELLKFARETSGDLIVMAHHTRGQDSEEAVMGSTLEQVVLRSACPVASVCNPDN